MTLADYSDTVHQWCLEVETQAIALFESGVHPADCTGLAINCVESRRKKKAQTRTALAAPPGFPVLRNES